MQLELLQPLLDHVSQNSLFNKNLAQLDLMLLESLRFDQQSYFIKTWIQVRDHCSLHLFFNKKTFNFSAILEKPGGSTFIPSSHKGFDLIKTPFLHCKSLRNKLSSLEPSKLVDFFRKELRYPLIKETCDSYIIELNIGGLLGGGAKVSRSYVLAQQEEANIKKGSNEYNYVLEFLKKRYMIVIPEGETPQPNPQAKQTKADQSQAIKLGDKELGDKLLLDRLTERICFVLPVEQTTRLEKHLNETIDAYEEAFLVPVVMAMLGKTPKQDKLTLADYTQRFGSRRLCIQLLRKGYFAKEREKGGIGLKICEKILAKLSEETKPFFSKTTQLNLKKEGESFDELLSKLEMKEKVQALLSSLSKIKAKKAKESIMEELGFEDELEDFDEFNYAYVSKDKYDRIKEGDFTVLEGAGNPGSYNQIPGSQTNLLSDVKNTKKATEDKTAPKVSPTSKYLDRVRLNVLSEMNLLDHEPSSLVELHNLLELEAMNPDKKKFNSNSNNSKLKDIKSLLKSIIIGYKENESKIDPKELDPLIPLAFVQDKEIFRKFLETFLEDFRNDVLFSAPKIRMLSFILISTLRDQSLNGYIHVDDLINILKIIKPKIEGLSITTENTNLQEAINALNDVLFLMGFIKASGFKESDANMVKELTKYLQTHALEKASNTFTNKSKNPSLEIKREYAIEALKRIDGTSYESWQKKLENILEAGQIAVDIGKGIFLGDMTSIGEALLQLGGMATAYYKHQPKTWFDNVNRFRFLAQDHIQKIISDVFANHAISNKNFTFYVAEFLLSVISQPRRKLLEKKIAVQVLWSVANGYHHVGFNVSPVKSVVYKYNGDIVHYVKESLLALAQNSELELSMYILYLVENPPDAPRTFNTKTDQWNTVCQSAKKSNHQEDNGIPFFLRVIMEKKPKLYALAKLQKHSEKTLEKPAILIDFRGIDREKDFDDAFIRKFSERAKGVAKKEILINSINFIKDNLDIGTATKKSLIEIFENNKIHFVRDKKPKKEDGKRRKEDDEDDDDDNDDDFDDDEFREELEDEYDEKLQKKETMKGDEEGEGSKKEEVKEGEEKKEGEEPKDKDGEEVKGEGEANKEEDLNKEKEEPKKKAEPKKKREKKKKVVEKVEKVDEKKKIEDEKDKKRKKEMEEEELRVHRAALIAKVKERIPDIVKKGGANLFDTLEAFLGDPSKTVLLIQGDAGTGKTLLLRLIEQKLWKRYNLLTKSDTKNPNRLPLRITLSEVRTFDKAVEELLTNYGCASEEIHEIKKEPAVILFDGYDEINQNINLYDLNKLETWKDVKVIFTSRKENLTSLKEDYILCFAPNKNPSKVLSHSILPISKEQIKKYFSAQTNQNQEKIDNLEKELKEINGNGVAVMPVTTNLKRKIKYLNNFRDSDRYGCLTVALAALNETLPKIKALQLTGSETLEEIDSKRLKLIRLFTKRITELKQLTDPKNVAELTAEITKNEAIILAIETDLDAMNNILGTFGSSRIQRLLQKFRNLTNLKDINQVVSAKFEAMEEDIEQLTENVDIDLDDMQELNEELFKIENKYTAIYFKEMAEKLRNGLEQLKEFEKQLKPTGNSITKYLQDDISKLEKIANPKKIKETVKKLHKILGELKGIGKALEWLYRDGNEQDEKHEQQPEQKGSETNEQRLSFANLKHPILRLQESLKLFKETAKELKIFDANYLNPERMRFALDELIDDESKHEKSLLAGLSKAFEDFEGLTGKLKELKKDSGNNHIEPVQEFVEEMLRLIHVKSAHFGFNKLLEHIKKSQQAIKSYGHSTHKTETDKIEEILDKFKTLETSIEIDSTYNIREINEMIEEIIEIEKEIEGIKDNDAIEVTQRITIIDEDIKNLKKFTDSKELNAIIRNFKDIVISPFMLKMLLQTLIQFPKSAANKADLYRLFSKIHFEREKDKLLLAEKIPPKFNIIDSFYHYSKDLAINMFIRKVTSIQAKSNGYRVLGVVENRKNNIWNRFFDDNDLITKLSRRGAQIIEDDGVVRFIHKSIMEYFAARQFYDEVSEYNADNQEEVYDPCLNKGLIIDSETAVYQFIKDIADSKAKKNHEKKKNKNKNTSGENDDDCNIKDDVSEIKNTDSDESQSQKEVGDQNAEQEQQQEQEQEQNIEIPAKEMIIFDKKMLEILNSNALQKAYGDDFRQFDTKYFYPNLFLMILMRRGLKKKIIEQKEDLTPLLVINSIFKWIFSPSEASRKFVEMIDAINPKSYSSFWPLLPDHYHLETKQKIEGKPEDAPIIAQRKTGNIRLFLPFNPKGSYIATKYGLIARIAPVFFWELDVKLFLYGSQESIAVLKAKNSNKYFALDSNKLLSDDPFTVIDSDAPWDTKDCKWIFKMNRAKKTHFTLRSLSNSSKVIHGCFKEEKDYKVVFKNMCSSDVHGAGVCDGELFHCVTCNKNWNLNEDDYILCKSCKESCHADHETKPYKKSGSYCDCRFLGLCQIATGCNSRFNKEFNQDIVMFKCNQCPDDKKNTILCMACKNHHDSTHQNFERVSGNLECECDCISNRTQILPARKKVYYDENEDLDDHEPNYNGNYDAIDNYAASDDEDNEDADDKDEDDEDEDDDEDENDDSVDLSDDESDN